MNRFILPAALAFATLGGAVQAQTAGPSTYQTAVDSQIVRFGDLDVATAAGAQRLAFRLHTAARSVCGGDSSIVRTGMGFEPCVKGAVERAAARLNNPMVTAALGLSTNGSTYAGR